MKSTPDHLAIDDEDLFAPADIPYADPCGAHTDYITATVRELMTLPGLETALDNDWGDHRCGRGYFVLRALLDMLIEREGLHDAANTLLISAARTNGEAFRRALLARQAARKAGK